MDVTIIGFEKPYTSPKNNQTYYKVLVSYLDTSGYDASMSLEVTPSVFAQLQKFGKNSIVRVLVSPRIFLGKLQGLTGTYVAGTISALGELQAV
jgi:hypothetical protein